MTQRHSTGPPFFRRLVSLVKVRVVANKTINFVRIKSADHCLQGIIGV